MRLVDDRDVGGDVAGDDGLTEAPVRADDNLVVCAVERVDGEHDTGGLR